jgi:hypothetical protein
MAREIQFLVGSVGDLEPQSHISNLINKSDTEGLGDHYNSKSSSSSNDSF